MILAIDIGGTKTLVALCTDDGKISSSEKFPTPKKYPQFIKELLKTVGNIKKDYHIVVVAAPGKIDRKTGVVQQFGNLPWKNAPIAKDLHKYTKKTVLIENDANLAGLAAAHSVKPLPHKSLYITISTGIGTGFVVDGVLDPNLADGEGGDILLEHDNKLITWEKIASGKAIVAKYGKRASDIDDPKTWDEISKLFAIGMADLSAVLEPDVILIGGGVGTHFKKYEKPLKAHLKEILPPIIDMPKILPTPHAEEAVIYGCAILAKQHGNNK